MSLTCNVTKRPENETSSVKNYTVFNGCLPEHMIDVTKIFKNDRLISTSLISDISVYICGNNECCIFIVDVSAGDQTSLLFLEYLTFGDRTDVLFRNVGSQLPARLINVQEDRRHHLVQ